MAEITTTKVQVSVESDVAVFTGDLSGDQLKDMLQGAYPFLANSVFTETTDPTDPNTKLIIFSERMGTKGCPSI